MTESEAIQQDAQRQVTELRNVARALWRDRDDPMVLSELLAVLASLRAARAVVRREHKDAAFTEFFRAGGEK